MVKISKEQAQKAKDAALRERQRVRASGGKHLTSSQNEAIRKQTEIIEAADTIINEEE